MNRIYQNIKAIPLILTLIYSTSFASINSELESQRIDSNKLTTQKFNDDKLTIDFVTDHLTLLKNTTLSVNNIAINQNNYYIDCKKISSRTKCTVTINPTRSSLLNGKFILRATNGDTIITGNSNHELTFALDKLNPNKLKISNSLTDQPVRIDMINGKPLTDSILAPLSNMVIDLPSDGMLLECSIDGENLTYVVRNSNQLTTTTAELNTTNTIDNKIITVLTAGGGMFVVGAGAGALLHKFYQKHAITKKYYRSQENLIKEIREKTNKAELIITEAKTLALKNCTCKYNQEALNNVIEITGITRFIIETLREYLIANNSILTLDALNIAKTLDEHAKMNKKANEALKYAGDALKIAQGCHNGSEEKTKNPMKSLNTDQNYQQTEEDYSNRHSSLDQTAQEVTQIIDENKRKKSSSSSRRCSDSVDTYKINTIRRKEPEQNKNTALPSNEIFTSKDDITIIEDTSDISKTSLDEAKTSLDESKIGMLDNQTAEKLNSHLENPTFVHIGSTLKQELQFDNSITDTPLEIPQPQASNFYGSGSFK